MYLVKYSKGSWDDYFEVTLFVTESEDTAKEYVDKFNTILNKWKSFLENNKPDLMSLSMEDYDAFHDKYPILYRYYDVTEINGAKYEQIKRK